MNQKRTSGFCLINTPRTTRNESHSPLQFNYTAAKKTLRDGPLDSKQQLIVSMPPTGDFGTVSLTELGRPLDVPEGQSTPILMTRLPLLPFIELGSSEQSDWTNQRDIIVTRGDHPDPAGSPYERAAENLSGNGSKNTKYLKAVETGKYHVKSSSAQELCVERIYEIKTLDGSEPSIHLTGTESWTFDHTLGMPIKSDLKGPSQSQLKDQRRQSRTPC